MKILFICNQNQNRSKTAEALFSDRFETRSAGLYNVNPVTAKEISWADIVVVMEDIQRSELARRFPKEYMQKRIVSLQIPDIYKEGQVSLKKRLAESMESYLSQS
ncbi:MAG TPA: phosphotyrosine protein phosphatase [Candidatus Nanoarchaeia archaeon]|nr:phosphotyrosine protein phosphatase [Candidatus Nanoarchaeia archaeon]